MSHGRKDIRDAVKALLTEAEIVPEGAVFANRAIRIQDLELPVINVTTSDEASETSELCPGRLKRRLTVIVEATAIAELPVGDAPIPVDDVLDELADKIEDALGPDIQWGGSVTDQHLVRTEISQRADGKTVIGSLRMSYEALYFY